MSKNFKKYFISFYKKTFFYLRKNFIYIKWGLLGIFLFACSQAYYLVINKHNIKNYFSEPRKEIVSIDLNKENPTLEEVNAFLEEKEQNPTPHFSQLEEKEITVNGVKKKKFFLKEFKLFLSNLTSMFLHKKIYLLVSFLIYIFCAVFIKQLKIFFRERKNKLTNPRILEKKYLKKSILYFFLNKFSYHLISAILLIAFYEYLKITARVIINEKTINEFSFFIYFFWYIYNCPFYELESTIFFLSKLLFLSILLFSIDFIIKRRILKETFIKKEALCFVNKKTVYNLSFIYLVIILFSFLYALFTNIDWSKWEVYDNFLSHTIKETHENIFRFLGYVFIVFPNLLIVFCFTSFRIKDLRSLVKSLFEKFRKV